MNEWLALSNGDITLARYAGYANTLLGRMAREHGKTWQSRMRRRNNSVAYHDRGLVYFGWNDLEYKASHGFNEYVSIWAAAWDNAKLVFGFEAIYRIVLHEAAHLVCDGRRYGSCHNAEFVAALRELRTLYPYSECVPAAVGITW